MLQNLLPELNQGLSFLDESTLTCVTEDSSITISSLPGSQSVPSSLHQFQLGMASPNISLRWGLDFGIRFSIIEILLMWSNPFLSKFTMSKSQS